ncbi:uncharacterized protein LOC123532684 isoform X3 [Mercenaria mercenaria]|uniref:uncharacterized protein LOC123532684 isoform X3 n=1 Tax=Mercenaria mercenaria TaxID=6596 RepID=UPI00234E7B6C|nr:uncharacterized protein LOC123532684 isoform X3 [Mercenaria mercenaria]
MFGGESKMSFGVTCSFLIIFTQIALINSQNWRGNIETYKVWKPSTCKRCICQYPTYCGQYRYFTCMAQVDEKRCQPGWRHRGDYNCNIPICRPNCGPGECIAPNTCDCKNLAVGAFCQTLICSYDRPCYPGNCYDNNKCNCTAGFTKESSSEYGCLKMGTNNKPFIGKSTTIIQHIRRTDNKFLFYFLLDGTDETPGKLIVWSNQRVFNEMEFQFETTYEPPEPLTERPAYVHSTRVGITEGTVFLRVLNYKNEEHPTQKYDIPCSGTNQNNPKQLFNCSIIGEEFKTLIEHSDTLKVTFAAKNGGYRRLSRLGSLQPFEYFEGQTATKNVYFKFDFQAPKHCTEDEIEGYKPTDCGNNATILDVVSEFTKDPITVYWKGWTDDLYGSQMWMYYLELHKLVVNDATLHLTERDPVGPMDRAFVMHMGDLHTHTFTPKEPGMYSILLEVRDISNNSRIARRFVLYDSVSNVELNTESLNGLHISSAKNHTGFKWQSMGTEGENTTITVDWTGYFKNKAHEDGFYNNEIQRFKPQFEDLEDDGILFTRKFVDPKLDDDQGKRRLNAIPNIHGIVQFEYQYTRDVVSKQPGENWTVVHPLSESTTIIEQMSSGDQIKVWVRARDILNNTNIASTMVTTDFSPPSVSSIDDNTTTYMVLNTKDGPFNYSSRLHLTASDTESGVRELGLDISIMVPGQPDINVKKTVKANTDDTRHPDRDDSCIESKDKSTCFLQDQTVYLDNCWLTVPEQSYLSSASATVNVLAYNQAMLTSSVSFEIPSVTKLTGLERYTGPKTAKVENVQTGSFRIVWDFPKKMSCYAIQTEIIIILFKKNADGTIDLVTNRVPGSSTYFEIASLDPDTEYEFTFTSKIGGKEGEAQKYTAKTKALPVTKTPVGLIVGVAVGVLVIVAIVIVIFVFLVRRGYIHPQERARRVKRAMTKKYRETFYGDAETTTRRHKHAMGNPAYDAEAGGKTYDNRKTLSEHEELYLYGGMDINMPEVEHIDRSNISFEGIIKDGHFARIYKATLRTSRAQTTVVAKTLKEKFTPDDEMLMRAKINFTGTVVGEHPNVLKFLGAVVGDDQMGPFIVYEYCENGTLKDYLVSQKNHVTIELQEHLFRFGLDVAKGMEYLAGKGIVHRRLAARNILLTFLNEVKISGFGPQPDVQGDGDSEKQERIPIKWMAPECMTSTKDATERSDVWSYAVVLWEIFTLGDTPYPKMKSRQLPIALKKGERLPKPEQCDDTWYGVMERCWEYDPSHRPVFAEVRSELDEMFVASPGDDYYYYKR